MTAAMTLAFVTTLWAQDDKLIEGKSAPGLDIEEWVKGPETTIGPGKVYILEFWAPRVEACKRAMPILSSLQKDYRDDGLVVIAVTGDIILSRADGSDSRQIDLDQIKSFVRREGDRMDFVVAYDRRDGTFRAWMDGAEKKEIPTAFIVDRQGKIARIGSPLDDNFRRIVRLVLSGRYDPALQRQADPMIAAARKARKERNWRVAMKQYDDVVNVDNRIFADMAQEKFEMMVMDMQDKAEAYKYVRETLIAKTYANDAEALRMIAEKISTDPKIDPSARDYDVALAAAEAAQRLAGPEDAQSLNTLALVRFQRGDLAKAADLQKQAWMLAPPKYKAEFGRTMRSYQEAVQRSADKPANSK